MPRIFNGLVFIFLLCLLDSLPIGESHHMYPYSSLQPELVCSSCFVSASSQPHVWPLKETNPPPSGSSEHSSQYTHLLDVFQRICPTTPQPINPEEAYINSLYFPSLYPSQILNLLFTLSLQLHHHLPFHTLVEAISFFFSSPLD